MKTDITITFLILLISTFITNAQQITPLRGNSTVCPGDQINYTVSGTTNCGSGENKTYVWTVTNGTFVFNDNVTSKTTTTANVDVWWNNSSFSCQSRFLYI